MGYSMYVEAYDDTKQDWANHGYDYKLATGVKSTVATKLRKLWYEFASTGAIATWTPVSGIAATDDVGTTAMRFLPDGASKVAPSWRAGICRFWEKHNAGPEFWWSNR